jgi:hypothetical protein
MHFGIGVGLAVQFIRIWGLWIKAPVPPVWAFLDGGATAAADLGARRIFELAGFT